VANVIWYTHLLFKPTTFLKTIRDALPAELKWLFYQLHVRLCSSYSGWDNKELPPNFGKAKVKEFGNWKIFCGFFYGWKSKEKDLNWGLKLK